MNTKQTSLILLTVLIKGLLLHENEFDKICKDLSYPVYQNDIEYLKVLESNTPIKDGKYKIYNNVKLYPKEEKLYTVRTFEVDKKLHDKYTEVSNVVKIFGEKLNCFYNDYYSSFITTSKIIDIFIIEENYIV